MSTVRMPPILRQAVGGAREVDASGGTVREVLDDLTGRFPAIRTHLFLCSAEMLSRARLYHKDARSV